MVGCVESLPKIHAMGITAIQNDSLNWVFPIALDQSGKKINPIIKRVQQVLIK
jgi:hypothetical protein